MIGTTPTTPTTPRAARRRIGRVAGVVLGAALVAGTLAGPAGAKEIGSGGGGGGGGGTTTCNPVSSLGYKGDATTSDTAFATIQVDYSVKPCVKDQVVTVRTVVAESANPAVVVWDDPNAPLSGKFTVGGVRVNLSYTATVSVYDAVTGAPVGQRSIFVAAVRKTGV